MQILILGGGVVGSYIAKSLSDAHDVTVVERRDDAALELEQIDCRVVKGDALQASVLFQAGASTADACFALTSSDEANLLAGSVAKGVGARRVAARVNGIAYRDFSTFDYRRHFGIDRFLSQDYLTAMELARRIKEPGAMLIEHFASGELELYEALITRKSSLTGRRLAEVEMPKDVRFGVITRDGRSKIATADDSVEVGDRATLFGDRAHVEEVKKTLKVGSIRRPYVAIIGGGEVGFNLGRVLEKRNFDVKFLERDRERCQYLASRFTSAATIVHGDGRRRNVLDEQNVGAADFAVVCTGDDEDNIMTCIEARELGTAKLLAVVKHTDYASVVKKLGIDEVVSPYEIMMKQAAGFAHVGALIFKNSTLFGNSIETLELEVGEDSPITRGALKDLAIPKPSLIAAAVRGGKTHIPHADFHFRRGDEVVAFVDKKIVDEFVAFFESEVCAD